MERQQFDVLLFDFEGTLVDFQWNLHDGAQAAKAELVRLGFDASSWKDNYALLRNNAVLHAVPRGLDKREVLHAIDAIYDHYDRDALSRWSLLPGVKALLLSLRNEKKVKLGLVTNVGKKAIEEALTKLGLAGLFDVVITRNDVELLKPNGEGIRIAIEKLASDHSSTLFIGDSVTDVLAARDAGVKVAIVQGGESDLTSLGAAGPTYLWSGIGELKVLYEGR